MADGFDHGAHAIPPPAAGQHRRPQLAPSQTRKGIHHMTHLPKPRSIRILNGAKCTPGPTHFATIRETTRLPENTPPIHHQYVM